MDEKYIIGGIAATIVIATFFCSCTWSLIFYAGLIRLGLACSELVTTLIEFFWQKPLDLATRYGKGSWVLVTGAAKGIGKQYFSQFAAKGFNIVAVDLDGEQLAQTEKQVREEHPGTEVIAKECDLTKLDTLEKVKEFLAEFMDKDISVVINNAGIPNVLDFTKTPPATIFKITQLHCTLPVLFTNILYNKLIKRTKGENKKLKSAIINMSSCAAFYPAMNPPIYSSTKAFLRYFTLGLNEEADKNLDILCVSPGFVTTDICANRVKYDSIPPHKCVKEVISAVGHQTETRTCLIHTIMFKWLFQSMWYVNHELCSKFTIFNQLETFLSKVLMNESIEDMVNALKKRELEANK